MPDNKPFKTKPFKKMGVVEAFFDMTNKMGDIIDNPCCYCHDKNKIYSDCPWFENGECNPAKNVCQISKIFYI